VSAKSPLSALRTPRPTWPRFLLQRAVRLRDQPPVIDGATRLGSACAARLNRR
jgi:hypothetical protein